MTPSRPSLLARLLAGGVVLAIAGCEAGPAGEQTGRAAGALIGGELTTDDPAVVAVTNEEQDALCSGVLISPSVVVTAAHCLDTVGSVVRFGDDALDGADRDVVDLAEAHPEYDPEESSGHDIALLRLGSTRDPLLPVRLNRSSLDLSRGARYRVAGFGRHDRVGPPDGLKRQGTTAISGAGPNSDVLRYGSGSVSTCFGDSGGPGFIATSSGELLAAVHSFVSEGCVDPNGGTRIDRYAEEFIQPWIQANDPSCAADGECAPIGCVTDPDCEPCGQDGVCSDGCESPDPDCPTRELGESCLVDSECATGLCIRWDRTGLFRFCSLSCASVGDCAPGMSCAEVATFGEVCTYDDEPPAGRPGDRCTEAADCGSYDCDDGVCVFRCQPGGFCPHGLECSDFAGTASACRSSRTAARRAARPAEQGSP